MPLWTLTEKGQCYTCWNKGSLLSTPLDFMFIIFQVDLGNVKKYHYMYFKTYFFQSCFFFFAKNDCLYLLHVFEAKFYFLNMVQVLKNWMAKRKLILVLFHRMAPIVFHCCFVHCLNCCLKELFKLLHGMVNTRNWPQVTSMVSSLYGCYIRVGINFFSIIMYKCIQLNLYLLWEKQKFGWLKYHIWGLYGFICCYMYRSM